MSFSGIDFVFAVAHRICSRGNTTLVNIWLPRYARAFDLPKVWFEPKCKKMNKFHGLDPQSLTSGPSQLVSAG